MTDHPLPRDLARPRRDPLQVRFWANIILGGSLLAIDLALLTYAIVRFT